MTYGSIKYAGKYGFGVFEVQSGIALETLLETFNLSSLALQSVLEALNTSPVALQSVLEALHISPVALQTFLEGLKSSPVALHSLLEAEIWRKEFFRPDQTWIKEPIHE